MNRHQLCLSCRTALEPDEGCELCGPAADVAALTVPEARRRAAQAASQPVVRSRERWPSTGVVVTLVIVVGTASTTTGAVMAAMSETGPFPGLISVGGAVLTGLLTVLAAVAWSPKTETIREPLPAAADPPPPQAAPLIGRVTGSATGDEVVAWGIEVRVDRAKARGAMLRDGHTGGFELSVERGPPVQVAAGRVRWLDDGGARRLSRAETIARIRAVDPSYRSDDESIFACDEALGWELRVGDEVALSRPVAGDARARGYRAEAVLQVEPPIWLGSPHRSDAGGAGTGRGSSA